MRVTEFPPARVLHSALSIAMTGIILLGMAACGNSTDPASQSMRGASSAIGSGSANTWIALDGRGNIASIAVEVSDAAISSLGSRDTTFTLPLPPGLTGIPFTEVELAYATHDEAPYDKPHLDAHFYVIGMADRMAIMSGRDTVMPHGMRMPHDYASDSSCEAMMGVHWMDTSASERNAQPFRCAFVYGFAKGQMTFMEPMVDMMFLLSHQNYEKALKRPTMMSGSIGSGGMGSGGMGSGGMTGSGGMMNGGSMMNGMMSTYPGYCRVRYDSVRHMTTIALEEFTR